MMRTTNARSARKKFSSLNWGNNITIEKVFGKKSKISGYNLYKFTAPEDGMLEVTADSHGEDTYGTLWDSRTAAKYLIKKGSGNG